MTLSSTLMLGGLAMVIRRRMALGGLSYDLRFALGQIEQKHRAAQGAVRKQDRHLVPIQERLTAIKTGGYALARQIQRLRDTRKLLDGSALELAIRTLERQHSQLPEGPTREECARALTEKRKALRLLDEMRHAEENCAMRLKKVEATLDTACLSLHQIKVNASDPPSEAALFRALDAEVAAIGEVERAFAGEETRLAQGLAR